MPELPEVETIKNTVEELVKGKTIKEVIVRNNSTVVNEKAFFVEILKNVTILNLSRKGKFIIFHFDNKLVLISHLRMEGKYYFYKEKPKQFKTHDLVIFEFSDGSTLIYNDTRHFGKMEIEKEEDYLTKAPLANVGPDPFLIDDSNIKLIYEKLKKSKQCIKVTLLDQSIMSGLGNIYVDEVLFATKIHPKEPSFNISFEQFKDILHESRRILTKAIKAHGSTIKSYHPSLNQSGSFQNELLVYGKENARCPNCHHRFNKIKVGGRGTTYCAHCQRASNEPYIVGLTGKIAAGKSTIAKIFISKGFTYIDCDKIVHQLYEKEDIKNILVKNFGDGILHNGQLNRAQLAELIFKSQKNNDKLKKLIHPLVRERVFDEIAARKNDKFIVEVPFIFESGIDKICNYIIYVDVSKKKQLANLLARGSNVENMQKLDAIQQCEQNLSVADYVIQNNCDFETTNRKIIQLIDTLHL